MEPITTEQDPEATGQPHDDLAERGVLGACLIDQDALNHVADLCAAGDFYSESHRTIFDAVLALHLVGADVDMLTVASELQRQGTYDRVGGAAYLDQLTDVLPIHAHVEDYARRIAKAAQRRATLAATVRLDGNIRAGCDEGEVEAGIEKIRRAWEAGTVADTPLTLHQLLRKQFEQASEWLIDRWWLAEGCGLFAAEEKSSKTTLALALGMCVASGRPWLGQYPVKQGPVLALFEEDHERTIRRRALLLGRAIGIDPHLDNFHVLCQTGITIGGHRSRGRGRLSALIRQYKPVLVILDPLRRLTPGVDENDSRAVSDYLGWLRRQQKECQTAIMCLHHFAKESQSDRNARPGQRRRITHRVRGSSDFLAWYDSLILVERETDTDHKINALHRGARRLDPMTVVVHWDDNNDTITLRQPLVDGPRIPAVRPQAATPQQPEQEEAF